MYKLLIVDDEPLIREGLAASFDWASVGFTVSGTAANGEDAYALVEACPPDVLITGVCMAGMNGIALLKKLRESGHSLPVVMISGYDDFEYARQALRYGAVEYLLKPVSDAALLSLFVSIRQTLDLRRAEASPEADRGTASSVRTAMPRVSLLAWLQGTAGLEATANSLLRPFGFRPTAPASIALLSAGPKLRFHLELLSGRFAWPASCTPFALPSQEMLLLLLPRALPEASAALRSFLSSVRQEADAAPVRCLAAEGTFETLPDLYHRLIADPSRFFYLTPWEVSAPLASGGETSLRLPTAESLADILRQGHPETLTAGLSSLGKELQRCRPNPDAAAIRLSELYVQVGTMLQKGSASALPVLSFYDFYCQLCGCVELSGYLGVLQAQLLKLADAVQAAQAKPDVVREVQSYLDRHYAEDLSLTVLAERYYLNASYLSALFSRKTGSTFSDYLENLRMQKAAALLRSSRLSVAEAAAAVGYGNARYFCRLFKKHYSCTPTEYRLRQSKEEPL